MRNTEVSKALSHARRHDPWLYELELDDEGWASLDAVPGALGKNEESGRRYRWGAAHDREQPSVVVENPLVRERRDRSFQVWAYSVSHNQLLIRSPKSKETPRTST